MFTELSARYKHLGSIAISLGSLYPLSWLAMFLLAPGIGAAAAHEHLVTQGLVYVGVGGLLCGFVILLTGLFSGLLNDKSTQ